MSFADVNPNRFTNATIRAFPSEPASPKHFPPTFPRTPDHTTATMVRRSRCACGARVDPAVGIYCSVVCARGDAFSSLTHTRQGSSSSLGCAFDEGAGGSSSRETLNETDMDDGSHYRRVKREERRAFEERMRRGNTAGEGSTSSPESTRSPSSSLPDLISSHSRNTSTASSIFSLSSCGSLSRNPSTSSHAMYAPSVAVGDAIMEDDNEVLLDIASARSTLKARRRPGPEKEPVPLARNNIMVNDMLDEIINMEESFRVPDEQLVPRGRTRSPSPERIEYLPDIVRPPRTPSPVMRRRGSIVPPGAPDRRRGSLAHDRPPSMYAHQSSLSESHTALYLATASPVSKGGSSRRRSASPKLSVRRSLSFTPESAGPIIPTRNYSPGLTPVRRKHLTPNAHHPPMQGWRFPTSSAATTPTRADFAPDAETAQILPQQLWPRPQRTSSLSLTGIPPSPGHDARAPPSSAVRLGMLMNGGEDADGDGNSSMDFDDDVATLRGGLAAPVAPFTRPGW